MMQVDLERCTGCGDCLDVCPVEAISMNNGKAWIDSETCLACEACAQVCPIDAICPSIITLPAKSAPAEIMPANTMIVQRPAELERLASHPAIRWTRATLSFAGREILPRLVDVVVGALERRLSQPEVSTLSNSSQPVALRRGGPAGKQRRRRKRGGSRT